MDATVLSTGISVQWPTAQRRVFASSPFTIDEESSIESVEDIATERWSSAEEDTYIAYQELAYHYAMEQTKSTVSTVLMKANANCYHQVLRYLERYCSAPDLDSSSNEGSLPAVSPLVQFPEFHPFPTAGIIAGADATFSEVWVNPLCQVLQRSFPVIFVMKEDFTNARRVMEWMIEQLEAVRQTREKEEAWLLKEVEQFHIEVKRTSAKENNTTRNLRSRTTQRRSSTVVTSDYLETSYCSGNDKDIDYENEDDNGDEEDEFDDKHDEMEHRAKMRRKKKRKHPSSSTSSATRAYSKWTMQQLFAKITQEMDTVINKDGPSSVWIGALQELLHEHIIEQLTCSKDDVGRSIQCYVDTMEWIKIRIVECRSLSPTLASMNVQVCSTEYSLALILYRIMQQFDSFLNSNDIESHPKAGLVQTNVLDHWRRQIAVAMKRHEDFYQLHHASASESNAGLRPKPFFLVCIEQLETFSQHVLDDFLAIWTSCSRQYRPDTSSASSSALCIRMGLIIGVASATSPALKHLNLSVVSKIDMQFFSLEDSHKCFDDILEALIVNANMPLCLGGDVLRWVAARHRTTQSIAMFIHTLGFLLFSHFKHTKWSFLSHFCLEAHWKKPLHRVITPSRHISRWIRRNNVNPGTVTEHLELFSEVQLEELRRHVFGKTAKHNKDMWMADLDLKLQEMRRSRRLWSAGWKCFRTACLWMDIPLTGEEFASHLALALDGKLGNTVKMQMIIQKLGTCSLRIALCILEDWRTIFRTSNGVNDDDKKLLPAVVGQLDELILLHQYAMETETIATTQKMLHNLRQEILDLFSDKLIVELMQSPTMQWKASRVVEWVTMTNVAMLEEHLRVNYHDKLKQLLLDIAMEDDGFLWASDVSLAFLYYQESAGIYLSLSDWYDTFASAVEDQKYDDSAKKMKTMEEIEVKARFVRVFCTLRHWGFVKSIGGREDMIEKVVFI